MSLARLYANAEPSNPAIQITNPPASGAATRWHGYSAREGFGTTRMRNHSSENNPANGNIHISQRYFPRLMQLPVFGQSPPADSVLPFPFRFVPACTLLELFAGCFPIFEFSWI
jgi:hypothetical protein